MLLIGKNTQTQQQKLSMNSGLIALAKNLIRKPNSRIVLKPNINTYINMKTNSKIYLIAPEISLYFVDIFKGQNSNLV